ncbi:MAG TPA: prepilin peptidase [Alphaproteobacteria bacterium]|jgi:prepilin peptidase CpaA
MFLLIIFLLSVFCAIGLGILSGLADFRGLRIPNIYPLLIACAFVPAFGAAHFGGAGVMGPLWPHLAVGAGMLLVTFIMYSFHIFGGGDSKLLTAYALWTGLVGLLPLVFYMAISGGLLGIVTIFIRKKKPFKSPPEGSWIARVQAGENRVPYGIPIGIGALMAFVELGYLTPETLGRFLGGG